MALADDINNGIDQALDTFRANMQTRGVSAWRKMAREIRSMETDADGRLLPTAHNNAVQNAVSTRLMDTINAPQMEDSIERMKNKLEPIREMTQEYYAKKFKDLPPPEQIIRMSKGLVTATKTLIDNQIGEAGFADHVVNPIASRLSNAISEGRSKPDTIDLLRPKVENRIRTFTDIKATTLLQQYGRRLNDLFGRLNSRKAKYTGGIIDTTRDFCAARNGKSYTIEEIQNWTTQDWDGKIPNTDRGSIFVNLGGFNCRHVLEWE